MKGATKFAQQVGFYPIISIHAPAKGATRPLTRPSSSARYFNPRSRKGSDPFGFGVSFIIHISIHAPVKGATIHKITFCADHAYFNPRSREGSDSCWAADRLSHCHFNPRSREGSDLAADIRADLLSISIHAPVKGATRTPVRRYRFAEFQSTLPRRERQNEW